MCGNRFNINWRSLHRTGCGCLNLTVMVSRHAGSAVFLGTSRFISGRKRMGVRNATFEGILNVWHYVILPKYSTCMWRILIMGCQWRIISEDLYFRACGRVFAALSMDVKPAAPKALL